MVIGFFPETIGRKSLKVLRHNKDHNEARGLGGVKSDGVGVVDHLENSAHESMFEIACRRNGLRLSYSIITSTVLSQSSSILKSCTVYCAVPNVAGLFKTYLPYEGRIVHRFLPFGLSEQITTAY